MKSFKQFKVTDPVLQAAKRQQMQEQIKQFLNGLFSTLSEDEASDLRAVSYTHLRAHET